MTGRYHDNVDIDPDYPRGLGICDRCGTPVNHYKLRFEYQWWAGTTLRSTGFMVCPPCYNPPAPFLQTLVLPPDPPPLVNARPSTYAGMTEDDISTQGLIPIDTEDNDNLVVEGGP